MVADVGDLLWCAQMPRECPPGIGWGARVIAAVLVIVAVHVFALNWARYRAVFCCLWFGVLPWWVYEAKPHYDCGYWAHLWLNLRYAWVWITGMETPEDDEFERTVNARPNWIRGFGRRARISAEQIVDDHAST